MTAGSSLPHYDVCGIPISALGPAEAAQQIVQAAIARRTLETHLCNAYTLSLVDSDDLLRASLLRADLNLPDGAPVAWLGRRQGTNGPVRGPGLVGEVVNQGRTSGLQHYYFGAGPGVAAAMAASLESRFPGAQTAGTESPPFGALSDLDVKTTAERIHDTDADVVWIGLGTPRQDYLVPRLGTHLDMPIVPVGAAFDFWAGNVAEAPRVLHGTGLEWVHRLASEPKRLWRRYLLGNPRFVLSVIRHKLASR
jgi:N-acetylglucosaminyldiphosphoundecaprenol N-acetyl-beta-D-mannosaminyltransferase